jgi:hypothetical protein
MKRSANQKSASRRTLICALWGMVPGLAILLSGCAGIEGVPYRADSPAARIYQSGMNPTNTAAAEKSQIVVPVEVDDPEINRYLDFSNVQVDVEDRNGSKRVTAFCRLSPKKLVWRVSLIKDGKEVHQFFVSNVRHYYDEVLPLEALALDASLPVPDKIIVTAVQPPQ